MAFDFSPLLQKVEEIDVLVKTDSFGNDDLYNKLILLKPLCENRLNNVYADLLAQNDMNQLQNHLNSLVGYVQAYKTGNQAQSTNIINSLNAIISILAKIPFVGKDETSVTLTKIIDDFSKKNADVITLIMKEKDDLAKSVVGLKQKIDSLSNEVANKNNELLSLTTEFQKHFLEAQEKRNNTFTDTQKKREDEFKNKENERDKQFNLKTKEFSDNAEVTLSEISTTKERVQEIYGIVGKSTITGTQKNYADEAKNMAHFFQGTSLLFMLIAIGVLFCLLQGQWENMTWSKFLYRFSMGSIFLLPAFFLANEGKKQRDKENRYRELQIKMAAITPYFLEISEGASKDNANLPEKDRVKLELAQKLLSPSKQTPDKNVILPPDIIELIKSFFNQTNKKNGQ